jgi:hypothetical protein
VLDILLPNTLLPLEYTILDVMVCTTNFCAVSVPATVKVSAYDAVWAYDADNVFVLLFEYDALVAFNAYDADIAEFVDPLIEPNTVRLPVIVDDPEIYGEFSIIY